MADLFVPLRPWVLNAERREHWREHRRLTDEMRSTTALIAGQISRGRYRLTPVIIIATPFQATGPLADTGNHYPAVKAAIDGIVDAGWLPNDTPEYVTGIVMLPPQRPQSGQSEGLHIRVEPAEQHPGVTALTSARPAATIDTTTTRPAEPVPPKGPPT